MDRREAEDLVQASPERYGPHILADEAERAHPSWPDEVDYLAGRIALTLEEAAAALGIGMYTLRTALRNGEIPSVKIGNRRLVPKRALERHLEALAYAESGALDQWQTALTSARANQIARNRRRRRDALRVDRDKRSGRLPT